VGGGRRIRPGAVVAVVAVVAFGVWYFAIRDSGGSSEPVTIATGGKAIGPIATTPSELSALAANLAHPSYWAGEQSGTRLELSRTKDARIYVRYLTGNAQIGVPKAGYLTVGTYPVTDAYSALQSLAEKPGAIVKDVADGGLAVTQANTATSVYLAYPDQDIQIEVYDPDAAKAMDLVTSGAIQPVG
jgi:hypothetical protein